jgi:hypothetical protein
MTSKNPSEVVVAGFKRILATILLAVSSCALAALPGEATVWTLKDFYPNFDSADTCALARGAGTTPHDWYAVVEPSLSTCIGATSGTCWRRGANPSRAEGGPGSGNGWDYQTWSSSNQFFYFGYILYGASLIDTLQMDNPESNVVLPGSVNDADPNPLWSTTYYNSGTHRYHDNSGNLLGSTTFGGYAQIEVNKIDDPVYGAPYNALQIEARFGPTVKGPWTILENIVLRQTMTDSDRDNCGGSAHAHNGMYQWSAGSTVLFQSDHGWQYRP